MFSIPKLANNLSKIKVPISAAIIISRIPIAAQVWIAD
jgi:hypothetical protein